MKIYLRVENRTAFNNASNSRNIAEGNEEDKDTRAYNLRVFFPKMQPFFTVVQGKNSVGFLCYC